jgi:hypothetical protein
MEWRARTHATAEAHWSFQVVGGCEPFLLIDMPHLLPGASSRGACQPVRCQCRARLGVRQDVAAHPATPVKDGRCNRGPGAPPDRGEAALVSFRCE